MNHDSCCALGSREYLATVPLESGESAEPARITLLTNPCSAMLIFLVEPAGDRPFTSRTAIGNLFLTPANRRTSAPYGAANHPRKPGPPSSRITSPSWFPSTSLP